MFLLKCKFKSHNNWLKSRISTSHHFQTQQLTSLNSSSNLPSLLFFRSSNSRTFASNSSTVKVSSSTPVLLRTKWTRALDSALAFISSSAFCESDTLRSAAANFSSHSRRSFSISCKRKVEMQQKKRETKKIEGKGENKCKQIQKQM